MRISPLFRHAIALITLLALIWLWTRAEFYGHEVLAEIAIFAILAISLDLVAGFAGMVSLGHGALFGFGAYMYALFAVKWNLPTLLAVIPASLITGVLALMVGALVSRAHGIFFIMITLAIGEMGYEYFFQSKLFGGDDGFAGLPRPDLSGVGVDLVDPATFSLTVIGVLVIVYLFVQHLLRSPYGVALLGMHENEPRMRALGLPSRTYKATAMGVSGAIAGLAGTLSAMHSQFITPELLSWTNSGEVLVMVILGGLGSLVGAVLGAVAVIAFKRYDICPLVPVLPERGWCPNPDYWHFWLGIVLILVVVTRSHGIVGLLNALWRRALGKRQAATDA